MINQQTKKNGVVAQLQVFTQVDKQKMVVYKGRPVEITSLLHNKHTEKNVLRNCRFKKLAQCFL